LAFALALAAIMAAFPSANSPTVAQGGAVSVSIRDPDFSPSVIQIEVGTTVTWLNAASNETHTATGAAFNTGDIAPGQSASVIFNTPGTYHYSCSIHPEKTGVIVVTQGGPPPPTAAPTEPPPVFEGCAHGYWKNHPKSWRPTGFSPNQTVESVFDVPDAYGLDNATLKDALRFGGGPGAKGAAKILLRAGVAAMLNASHPDILSGENKFLIFLEVSAALGSRDRGVMLRLATALDRDNNRNCPLR
jgi:plastocyanin